jgi:hypothetical protein
MPEKRKLPKGSPPDPDRKPVHHSPPGEGHGLLTAAHNDAGQEGAPDAEEECDAEQPEHGLLTAAHNREKRP